MKHSTQAIQLILSITVVSLIIGYVSKDISLNQKSVEIDNLKAELSQTRSLYNNLASKYNEEIITESQTEPSTSIEEIDEANNDSYSLPTESMYDDINQE